MNEFICVTLRSTANLSTVGWLYSDSTVFKTGSLSSSVKALTYDQQV